MNSRRAISATGARCGRWARKWQHEGCSFLSLLCVYQGDREFQYKADRISPYAGWQNGFRARRREQNRGAISCGDHAVPHYRSRIERAGLRAFGGWSSADHHEAHRSERVERTGSTNTSFPFFMQPSNGRNSFHRTSFEGCAYRQWKATKPTLMYDTWRQNRRRIGKISVGDSVQGSTGVVITFRPGIIRRDRDLPE